MSSSGKPKPKFMKRPNRLQIFSPNATKYCYIVSESSFPQHYKGEFWKISILTTQGLQGWKAIMRSYVYWLNMDKDIEDIVKSYKGCALAAMAPLIKYSPWLKTDRPWSRIHIDFAGKLDWFYYLRVVFQNGPMSLDAEISLQKIQSISSTFARFGVVDCLESDSGTKFTSGDFKDFWYLPDQSYHDHHLLSKVQQTGRALKRAPKKARGTSTGKALQQFLQVCRIAPNDNSPSSLPSAEVILPRKIKSVFDKLLPKQTKPGRTKTVPK